MIYLVTALLLHQLRHWRRVDATWDGQEANPISIIEHTRPLQKMCIFCQEGATALSVHEHVRIDYFSCKTHKKITSPTA